jgi:hypothetical protein
MSLEISRWTATANSRYHGLKDMLKSRYMKGKTKKKLYNTSLKL